MTDSILTDRKGQYTDFSFMLGNLAGPALTADAADPNAAAPVNERVVFTPKNQGQAAKAIVWADNTCTLEGWIYSKRHDRWVRVFSQAIAAAFVGIVLTDAIPSEFPFFLRVNPNGGGAMVAAISFY